MSFRPPILAVCLTCACLVLPARAWQSTRVAVDPQGALSYPADAQGNRIPDFSHAGYGGGGVPLPSVPIVKRIGPVDGDDTAHIQAALDEVGALPVQSSGYRGTLQLAPGVYEIAGTLRLERHGVVLAGSGDANDPAFNTILRRSGTSQAPVIRAGVHDDSFRSEVSGTRSEITTALVPVGARSFEVAAPHLYRIGDPVIVWHPSTQAWLDAVDRGGVTDQNYWRPGDIDVRYHRYVTAIAGNTITVDVPVFMHLDRSLAQSFLYRYAADHVVTRLGIERLQVDIVTAGETSEDHAKDAITFTGTEDSWIRDCTMKHFWHAGLQWEGSTRGTVERCRAIEPHSIVTGSRRYNFSMYHAQLILVRDCFADRGRHAYVCNGTSLDSGIVFLNCVSDRALTASEGHRRWSTGLLFDGLVATNRESSDILGLYNRGTYGTGHGWAAAHSVAWNCDASPGGRIRVQQPPTAQNYAIGCFGNVTGSGPFAGATGHIEGTGQAGLEPRSLYLAQLAARLAGSAPVVTIQPQSRAIPVGSGVSLAADAVGYPAPSYQWRRNGANVSGATEATLTIRTAQPADAGLYQAITTGTTAVATSPAILGVAIAGKVAGTAAPVGADILHPNGNVFDQNLLDGPAASITADPGQITRTSYVDLNDDIVQVEFSGAGTLTLLLDSSAGPALPLNYDQNVAYMKGHAGIVIVGADESTNVSVFSVGRANAVNQRLFRTDAAYDGVADIAFISILSANGRFGGLRTGNASYFATRGFAGVYAPGVNFEGPVYVGDIAAFDDAVPVLVVGSTSDARITGGDLAQDNGRAVQVGGLAQLHFTAGFTSHGTPQPVRPCAGLLEEDGGDVTARVVVNAAP